jgi:transcriptional regulator with XRE-family HTH domain
MCKLRKNPRVLSIAKVYYFSMVLVHLISLRMRELRYRHGFTQEEMAELIGVSVRQYQTIEAGREKGMRLETVEMLACAFNLHPWELIGPELPAQTTPRCKIVRSTIHYQRQRKGPYRRRAREGS